MTDPSADNPAIPYRAGQVIGAVSGVASALLWTTMIWDPASTFDFSLLSYAVVFIMILVSIIVVAASVQGHGGVLIVLFAISFFPVGLYVLAVAHWIRWVGIADAGFLVAGLLIWRYRRPEDN